MRTTDARMRDQLFGDEQCNGVQQLSRWNLVKVNYCDKVLVLVISGVDLHHVLC